MVVFANPGYLWLTLAVPPLVWWWLRRRGGAVRHPSADLLRHLPSRRARLARWGGALLRGAALLSLAVAAAGPRVPDLHTRIDTEGIALVMLVDVSGSMAEPDFDWNGRPVSRLEAVKKVFELFLTGTAPDTPDGTPLPPLAADFRGRATDLVGLVTFATRPETRCPLTLSHSVLLRQLETEQPRRVPGESETNLIDAIAEGLHRLHSAGPRRKVLVLLTDGEHNVPQPRSGWKKWQEAGQVAVSLGVSIYAIDAGGAGVPPLGGSDLERPPKGGPPTAEPSASPGQTRAQAVQTLQELARMTHGQYFAARDTASLLSACRGIDALERTEVVSFQYRRYHEGYPYIALAALALFAAAIGLELTVWRRVP
jgi:Ca-activated chloride channel family protein